MITAVILNRKGDMFVFVGFTDINIAFNCTYVNKVEVLKRAGRYTANPARLSIYSSHGRLPVRWKFRHFDSNICS